MRRLKRLWPRSPRLPENRPDGHPRHAIDPCIADRLEENYEIEELVAGKTTDAKDETENKDATENQDAEAAATPPKKRKRQTFKSQKRTVTVAHRYRLLQTLNLSDNHIRCGCDDVDVEEQLAFNGCEPSKSAVAAAKTVELLKRYRYRGPDNATLSLASNPGCNQLEGDDVLGVASRRSGGGGFAADGASDDGKADKEKTPLTMAIRRRRRNRCRGGESSYSAL